MEFLRLAVVMLSLLIIAHEVSTEKLKNILLYQKELAKKITKRQAPTDIATTRKLNQFFDFAEDKLIQHSQALEHLLKLVYNIIEAISVLAENISRNVVEPKLPDKIKTPEDTQQSDFLEGTRRSGNTNEFRRSFDEKTLILPLLSDSKLKDGPSEWCTVAVLCHRTMATVCGYDDNFGYGKFDDLCHLLSVNCFWKYNFALAPNCRPHF